MQAARNRQPALRAARALQQPHRPKPLKGRAVTLRNDAMKTLSLIVCGTILCLWAAGCASQRDVLILDQRLRALERQNRELQDQHGVLQKQLQAEVDRFSAASQDVEAGLRTGYAGMSASMDRVQQELRLLSGRMEEVEHSLQRRVADDRSDAARRKEQLDAAGLLAAQIDRRLTAIEQYLDLKPPAARAAAPPGAPRAGEDAAPRPDDPGLTDSQLYAQSKSAFDDGRMDAARQGFDQLLKRFPQSNLANNAQFWIGESYYREKWYEKAILEYQTVIEKYPDGNKVPAAMLKQGMAFLQLGDEPNARLVLRELGRRYPESSEARAGAEKLKEL
jgi:tol-pal system protein YbgF